MQNFDPFLTNRFCLVTRLKTYISFSLGLLQVFVAMSTIQVHIGLNICQRLIFIMGSLYYCHQLNRQLLSGNLYSLFILSVAAQVKSVHNRKSYLFNVHLSLIFLYTTWYATCLISLKFFNQKLFKNFILRV